MAQQSIEYGRRAGTSQYVFDWPIGASEVFKKKGGAFMVDDASGRLDIATATGTKIQGYALFQSDFTASSTEGATILPIDMDLDNIYELPINGATVWADTMRGKVCDLSVVSSIQGLNLGASAVDIVELIDDGTTNPAGTVVSALCRVNINNVTRAGVV